jgi:FkbM family methyltransferase
MEGNACYKYYTIRRFVDAFGGPPIKTILEVGANVGNVLVEMAECFPDARIHSYEIIPDHLEAAQQKTETYGNRISVRWRAVTSEHLFEDDLGRKPREKPAQLNIYEGLPEAGPGYEGGSLMALPGRDFGGTHLERTNTGLRVDCVTLSEALNELVPEGEDLDFLKTDSEGAECSFLGCALPETLQRIRFISGEYHDIKRFWPVMQKLSTTHYVNIVGAADLGSFFCERAATWTEKTILHKVPLRPMYHPALHTEPLWWHPFDDLWVSPKDYADHGLYKPRKTAYLVCGPVSSGNRVMAAVLMRSGCVGSSSTFQPLSPEELPEAQDDPFVMISHQNLTAWIRGLRARGHQRVVAVVMVREPVANIQSAIKRGHHTRDLAFGLRVRSHRLASNIAELISCNAEVEIYPYEGMSEEAMRRWLPHIGLEYIPGDLVHPGQPDFPKVLKPQNHKNYREYYAPSEDS